MTAIGIFIAQGPYGEPRPEDHVDLRKLEMLTSTPDALGAELEHLRQERIEISLYDMKRQLIATNVYMKGPDGWRIVLTHGNGPQVGFILLRSELVSEEAPVPRLSLDMAVADSVGGVGYIIANSLALIADAGHIATDVVALLMGMSALLLARHGSVTARLSVGWHRAEVCSAVVNAVLLIGVGVGQALMFGPLVVAMVADVPPATAGASCGVVQTVQQASMGLGVAVAGGLLSVAVSGTTTAVAGTYASALAICMIVQAVFCGFKIAEVTCPTVYTAESLSIGFASSVVYGFGVLNAAVACRLALHGVHVPRFLSAQGKKLFGDEP